MIKLLLCLFSAFAIGVATLQMRQQQLELRHRSTVLHGQILARQSKLWQQQLQVAIYTAPNAIAKMIGPELELVPEGAVPAEVANWLNPPPPAER